MAIRRYKKGTPREVTERKERGVIRKKWSGKIPVCVVYPNSYHVGMSNLAIHTLYQTLNRMSDVVCERCFFENEEKINSLESHKPLSSFAICFFTLSYELDYINIPKILERSSIGALAATRSERTPLIVGGGICVMANPEPVSAFFDLLIMGDIEATLPAFMETYRKTARKKKELLLEIPAALEWVYNPRNMEVSYNDCGTVRSFSPPGFRVRIQRYHGRHLATSQVISDSTEFADTYLTEGTRGCPSGCPFCLMGNIYRTTFDRILPVETDERNIGIIGGGVSFHPECYEIIKDLAGQGRIVHLPSLRLDRVSIELIELMKDHIKTLTFGIEAGTQRMRSLLGKPLTDRDISDKISAIIDIKAFNLKLYFMIGLPDETIEDIEAIVRLAGHIKHIMVKKGAKKGIVGSVTIHASPFIPKPGTPFQWLSMDDPANLKEKITRLRRATAKIDNTYFTHESVKHSFIQGILARGDRRTKDFILDLASGQGLNRILREASINPNFYVLRQRAGDEVFPWDFITGHQKKSILLKRLKSAFASNQIDIPSTIL